MNIKLLKKIITRLRRMRHPQHFNMDFYGEKNACGTTACIAGHALLLEGYRCTGWDTFVIDSLADPVNPATEAEERLDLTTNEADRLFYVGNWPKEFKAARNGRAAKHVYNDPKIAAARIEHFIATDGRE